MSKIRFSSNILKRLGEELNPGIEKGILELVKNAYDADAESCVVDIGNREAGGLLLSVMTAMEWISMILTKDGWF